MSDKSDLSEEDLFGDLDLQTDTNQKNSPPPVLTEISGQKPIVAPLPENVIADRFKPQTQAFKQAPPRNYTGLLIAIAIILVVGGGGVGALYFLGIGPFAGPNQIKHTVFPRNMPADKQVINFETTPPGALIHVNDNPTPFKTPHKMKVLAGRKYKVTFKLNGFDDLVHRFEIKEAGKPQTKKFKLVKAGPQLKGPKGVLFIECWPVGANINIGLRDWGKCSKGTVRIEIPGGTHPTNISYPGYDSYTKSMTIPADEVTTKKIILQKSLPGSRKAPKRRKPSRRRTIRRPRGSGQLSIACQPNADVFWRGKKIGTTPLTHKFPSGRQRLVLKNNKIGALRGISVVVRSRKVISKKFTFRKGKIKFIVKPWADVYLNGKKIGQTPIPPAKVYEGYHTVILKNKKKKKRFRVRVRGGETYPVFHAFP